MPNRSLVFIMRLTMRSVRDLRPGKLINLGNHLAISHPFIFQILGFIIVNVMRFGNPVQPVDAGIPTGQSFFQMGARSHILIAGPMKFNARLLEGVLHIE